MRTIVRPEGRRLRGSRILSWCGGAVTLTILLLGFAFLMLDQTSAQVPDFVVNIDDRASRTGKEEVKESHHGKGTQELFEVTFKVKITNTKPEELSKVTMRLIPFFVSFDWSSNEEDYKRGKIQELTDLTFPSGEEKIFEFESMNYSNQQTYDKDTRTRWRSGQDYRGCVVELIQNGQKLVFKVAGDSKLRKAYDAMSQKPNP